MGNCGGKTVKNTSGDPNQKQSKNNNKKRESLIHIDQSMFVTLNTGQIRDDYTIGKHLGEGAFG